MPDPRFFHDQGPISLRRLTEISGARLDAAVSHDRSFTAVAPLRIADADTVSYFSDSRYVEDLTSTRSGACFVPQGQAGRVPATCIALITPEPQVAYAKTAAWLYQPRTMKADDPLVHPSAVLEDNVHLAPGVVIGAGARIGSGSSIGPNSVIGPGVEIGRDCQIGSKVSVSFALVGDRVRMLAGAVIGEAGFGIAGGPSGVFDIPQLGRVILQDDVTVGANSCIDRGGFEDTVIGEGTKIDNLCQIGHNTRLGRGCLLVSQVGISGSVTAGDGVRFGGQVGIADHLTIGDGATLMAGAGLISNVPAGEVWGGFPAVPRRQWLRQSVWLGKASGRQKRGEDGNEA